MNRHQQQHHHASAKYLRKDPESGISLENIGKFSELETKYENTYILLEPKYSNVVSLVMIDLKPKRIVLFCGRHGQKTDHGIFKIELFEGNKRMRNENAYSLNI